MNTLKEFSSEAARRYLQTAVFVDDRIYHQVSGMPVDPVVLPRSRKPTYMASQDDSEPPQGGGDAGLEDESQSYHPKNLVSSFARQGIVCALYEPQPGFSTDPDSEIFKLCERPDIVVLDWDFSGDRGQKSLDLIVSLVRQSQQALPHHTRLLAIYTADTSLVAVANQISDRLTHDGFSVDPINSQYRMRSGAIRVVVLGKAITRFGEEEFTVNESDLADRLISEFAEMHLGILPSYVLHGLAAIRRNSKRILDKFNDGLDGAFLLHRALLKDSEEAFEQLPELLGDELRAIAEDASFTPLEIQAIVADALAGPAIRADDKSLIASCGTESKMKKVVNRLPSGTPAAIPDGHKHLAVLFGSRTQYSVVSRVLSYGSIIRFRERGNTGAWSYAICLIPVCDSLRLDPSKKARFPFWTLQQGTQSGGKGMILQTDGEFIELTAKGKASEMLWMEEFDVDGEAKVVKAKYEGTVFAFSGSVREIEWVGQLKPLHAQRIAHDVAQGLSRVGLLEAEWLRISCG